MVEIQGGTVYFPLGQHCDCDTASIADAGNLYLISFEDFADISSALMTPGAYRLDTLGREAEDPYRQFAH